MHSQLGILIKYLLCSFIAYSSVAIRSSDGVELYLRSFDDFRIKEKSNPIPGVARDLQYSVDYIRNPCQLAQTAELAGLLAVDELQRQYKVCGMHRGILIYGISLMASSYFEINASV